MRRRWPWILLSLLFVDQVWAVTPRPTADNPSAQETFHRVVKELPLKFPSALGPNARRANDLGAALGLINRAFEEVVSVFPKKTQKVMKFVFNNPRVVPDGDPRWDRASKGTMAASITETGVGEPKFYVIMKPEPAQTKIIRALLRFEEAIHSGHMHMRVQQIGEQAYGVELDSKGLHPFTELAFAPIEKRLHDLIAHSVFLQDASSAVGKIGDHEAKVLMGWHAERVKDPFSRYVRSHHVDLANVDVQDIEAALQNWGAFDLAMESVFDGTSQDAYMELPISVRALLDAMGPSNLGQ